MIPRGGRGAIAELGRREESLRSLHVRRSAPTPIQVRPPRLRAPNVERPQSRPARLLSEPRVRCIVPRPQVMSTTTSAPLKAARGGLRCAPPRAQLGRGSQTSRAAGGSPRERPPCFTRSLSRYDASCYEPRPCTGGDGRTVSLCGLRMSPVAAHRHYKTDP
jgi:hypothetical protein